MHNHPYFGVRSTLEMHEAPMTRSALKTTSWLIGGLAALFIVVQALDAGTPCKAGTRSSSHAQLNASAGPDGPVPHLW
jgi:hypothetical protein